jgi:site-specific DNA-cytosine methylase
VAAPRWTRATALDPNHKPQCTDRPSSTVAKSWGSSPQERFVTGEQGIRRLSAAEVFRLQGFPDGWFDVAGVPETVRVALAGNAVPPPVAEAAFRAMPLRGTVLELFAGAGGSALGAKRAGFDVTGCVDLWPPACAVCSAHFPRVACKGVDDIEFHTFKGRLAVISGGPPCQPFSSGGRRLGPRDPRDRCTALPLILAAASPRAFLFEEARELYNHEDGAYWRRLKKAFNRVGYRVSAMLVNSHDYGVPQIRCRAFVAGFRDADPHAWADALMASARPGAGGVVADVMEEGPEEWGPWAYGCRRVNPRDRCPTRIIDVD